MTINQLLRQLNQQVADLRYRERRALTWIKQGEQNKLYALGALAVIQSEIGDLLYLVEQLEREGISDSSPVFSPPVQHYTHTNYPT